MNVPSMKKPTALWTSRRRLRGGYRSVDSLPRTGLFQDGPFRDGRSRDGRHGFTLAELLVVIAIIGFLSAIGFGALQQARKSTAIDRTKRTVTKIHYLLMEKLDSYRTRRVDIDINEYASALPYVSGVSKANTEAGKIARAKLSAIRDLMRMEMPDRWSDVVTSSPEDTPAKEQKIALVYNSSGSRPVPALLKRYRRGYFNAKPETVLTNASPELLYMIVMGMPGAAEQFHSTEIGDTDDDGLREFIDAWGNPIRYLRWPAGFVPPDPSKDFDVITDLNDNEKRDYFDTLGVYPEDFTIFPLVYSAGPDEIYDIDIVDKLNLILINGDLRTCVSPSGDPSNIGMPLDEDSDGYGHYDNITNHALDNR